MAETLIPSTGLVPTLDVPPATRKSTPDLPPAYRRCICGVMVLDGVVWETGERRTVEEVESYQVVWQNGEPLPQLRCSGGWPIHRCAGEAHSVSR